MPGQKITRPTYRQPNGSVRTDAYRHGDSATEQENYHLAIEQVHGSGLHGWGIAAGMNVTGVVNAPDIKIEPGIAIDREGHHISLAATATAEIGPNADNPGQAATLVPVNTDGATFPTGGLQGVLLLTIQFWETFDTTAYANDGLYRFHHTPWIRLQSPTGFADDGRQIVLAQVTLDPTGAVTGLAPGSRRQATVPAGGVELRTAEVASPSPNFAIGNTTAGRILPRAGGGLEIKVPRATDQVEIGANDGTFAKLAIAANQIAARRSDGIESVMIDSQTGNITAGNSGVNGGILVKDSSNRLVITLDSFDGALVVGTNGKEGEILVKDIAGQNSVRVDGATGTVLMRRVAAASGNTIDVDAPFFRIHGLDLVLDGRSGNGKRALVDLNNRLAINFATDYAGGVDIGKLHLADHVKLGFWEEWGQWNPPNNQWHRFFTQPLRGIKQSEWSLTSMCEIGMYAREGVEYFWWETDNQSFVDGNGDWVVAWEINKNNKGNDWMPFHRTVMWIAVRN